MLTPAKPPWSAGTKHGRSGPDPGAQAAAAAARSLGLADSAHSRPSPTQHAPLSVQACTAAPISPQPSSLTHQAHARSPTRRRDRRLHTNCISRKCRSSQRLESPPWKCKQRRTGEVDFTSREGTVNFWKREPASAVQTLRGACSGLPSDTRSRATAPGTQTAQRQSCFLPSPATFDATPPRPAATNPLTKFPSAPALPGLRCHHSLGRAHGPLPMSAFTPRAVQPAPRSPLAGAGRGREEPGGAGRGPGRDSPRLRDYLLPSPGRPPLGLRLRPYWLPLILMDIRALGPPQADSTPEEPGERRSQDLRRVRTLRAISEKGRHKGPTLNPSGHTMPVEPEPDSGGRRENQEIASRLPPSCPRSPLYPLSRKF